MMTKLISAELQRKLMTRERHLKEARENLELCAGKRCYSPPQLTALRLFVENLEQEFECLQAMSERT